MTEKEPRNDQSKGDRQMTTTTGRLRKTAGAIFAWRSLRARVTIFTLAIFLISIWSLSFFASHTLHNDMKKTLSDQQFSAVSILAADINDALAARLKLLEMVAEQITPTMLGNAAATQTFLDSHLSFKMLFNYGGIIMRPDGTAIAETPSHGRIGLNYSDRDYVIEALKGGTVIGKPVIGKTSHSPILSYAAPIREPQGKVIGVVAGITDLGKPNFLTKITDHGFGITGGYLLVSPKLRTVVFATDKKRIMEVLPAPGINLLNTDGTLRGYRGADTDISVRKATEEELAIKQRQLQTLNETLVAQVAEEVLKSREKDILLLHQDKLAAIGQLAAGMAHEINNPIAFIISNLEMLKKYNDVEQKYLVALEDALAGCCPEERRKALEELRQGLDISFILRDIPPLLVESLGGAERIKQIVLDLKGFARLDEGKMIQTDLNHCVKSTANIVCNAIREVADIELQLNEIPLVVCNPQQINQVIANLLVNASQAMDEHGVITVTSRQEGEEVILSISDTGRGMTEEVRKRIFEPFFTTRDIGEGTGLGLSIAYGIIKQHDGEITLESEPGRGTTCTIRLPIKRNIAQGNNKC